MRCWISLFLLLTPVRWAPAQAWSETFADGDLSANPAWSGDTAYWRLTPAGSDWVLESAGPVASDTLTLETPSSVTYGSWTFTAAYAGGPLSNFNLIRVYLASQAGGALHEAAGFYLQIGSNERDVRLYRQTATSRTLMGQSTAGLLVADAATSTLRAVRRAGSGWAVSLDDSLLFTAADEDPLPDPPVRFGLWVKHTRTRADDFRFDDVFVEAGDDTDPDTTSPPPPIPPGALVINEIHFAPSPAENEFVELLNRSDAPIDLRGLALADNRDEPVPITTEPTLVAAGEYAVLVRDTATFNAAFPGRASIPVADWPSLNNDADAVRLLAGAALVDAVPYRAEWGETGLSLERRDPSGPSDDSANWGASVAPTRATPGRLNSLFAPDTTPPDLLLAEQQSAFTVLVFWSESVAAQSLAPTHFQIGDQPPETVESLSPVSQRLHFAGPIGGHRLRATEIADRTGNARASIEAPLAFLPAPGEVSINEILYEPLADPFDGRPDQPEYLELVNRSDRWLSLRALRLVGREDEDGAADTLRHEASWPVAPPDGFAVWFAVQGGDLAGAYPGLPGIAEVAWLPVDAASLGLGNAGDGVRLVQDGQVVDSVTYAPDWHHPLLADTRGLALERRWPEAPADAAGSWSTSVAPQGGTPGRPNAIFQDPGDGVPGEPEETITILPAVFSPDGDGRDDVCLVRVQVLEAPAIVRTRIFDAEGRLIRTLGESDFSGRVHQAIWDGRDEAGERVRIGRYIVLVEAFFATQKTSRSFKRSVVVATPLAP